MKLPPLTFIEEPLKNFVPRDPRQAIDPRDFEPREFKLSRLLDGDETLNNLGRIQAPPDRLPVVVREVIRTENGYRSVKVRQVVTTWEGCAIVREVRDAAEAQRVIAALEKVLLA